MGDYCVYILECSDRSYYIGITNNVELRIGQHKEGINPKCYTFRRRPVECVYVARFQDVLDAINWEKKIKRWSRRKKEALIQKEYEKLPALANRYSFIIRVTRAMARRAHHDTLISANKGLSP